VRCLALWAARRVRDHRRRGARELNLAKNPFDKLARRRSVEAVAMDWKEEAAPAYQDPGAAPLYLVG
jgi:hypothetical protein